MLCTYGAALHRLTAQSIKANFLAKFGVGLFCSYPYHFFIMIKGEEIIQYQVPDIMFGKNYSQISSARKMTGNNVIC